MTVPIGTALSLRILRVISRGAHPMYRRGAAVIPLGRGMMGRTSRRHWRMLSATSLWVARCICTPREREFVIDNPLVRIHFIIVMIRWTGLAPLENKAEPSFRIRFNGRLWWALKEPKGPKGRRLHTKAHIPFYTPTPRDSQPKICLCRISVHVERLLTQIKRFSLLLDCRSAAHQDKSREWNVSKQKRNLC